MIFYIIPEIRYGIGLPELSPEPMMIVTSHRHPAIIFMRNAGALIWCAEENSEEPYYQAHQLLELEKVQKLITDVPESECHLLTFKITPRFEKLAALLHAKVLMPSFKLNRFWEDKNKGMDELRKLNIPVKDAVSGMWQDFTYDNVVERFHTKSLVIQKPRGMAGSSTHFVHSQEEWNELGSALGINPLLKISPYLIGSTYTVNALVNTAGIYSGYPMFQITGDKRFTRYEGGTSGVDMSGGRSFSAILLQEIKNIIEKIGKKMAEDGFFGWFGVDFIVDQNDKVTIIEINPRFTASVSIFSQAQHHDFQADFWSGSLDLVQNLPDMMKPLPFTTLILRNVGEENMNIARNFSPGIYHLDPTPGAERLILKKQTVFIKDMTNPQEYLIIAKGIDTEIHPDGEMATIVTHRSAVKNEQIDDDLGKVANLVTMALTQK
ncbi:MAG: hypothetical protein A2V81_02005 [Candidatus Abawacabacteria bacterium RBG_16_42_10]|uniref:ATP-grasp domain-containing protein n=1 Tax=Candidatus Abawacabacteria bacterium RBG_16_42_10 TaxID=1817814 RepID=A0A1F4XKZ8_9BACT|nr:MAG: hypothetical protein A2V81_02005 [Candidatus Abawacabacteria bacterium RBG_16_42_10]